MIDGHAIAERASLLAHRKIATLVDESPEILRHASELINEEISSTGGTSGEQLWLLLFKRPWEQVRERMLAEGHEGRLLRSNSPFPWLVGPFDIDERRRLWRQAKSELLAEATLSERSERSPNISALSR